VRRAILSVSVAAFVTFNIFFAMRLANALPRYSSRYEQNCNLCHFNPTGGGMRTLYASQFIVPEEIAYKPPTTAVLEGLAPDISKSITVGADFRLLHFYADDKQLVKNFFQMQGALYVNFQATKRLSLYYDLGISQNYELFALGYYLPFNGYVKVGRFVPDYGWRFEDHTMFVREYLGFFPPRHTDVGVELGMYPKRAAINLSFVNGNRGSTQDENEKVAVVGRAAYRFNIRGVALLAGLSGIHNPRTSVDEGAAGGFWYFRLKDFAWIGDSDWVWNDPANAAKRTSFVTSNEFTYRVVKGADLKLTYDFFDPDWNLKTGSQQRIGGGVYFFWTPFVVLEGLVRSYNFDRGVDVAQDDYIETVVQFHFLY
jgi:hypothetical protein